MRSSWPQLKEARPARLSGAGRLWVDAALGPVLFVGGLDGCRLARVRPDT